MLHNVSRDPLAAVAAAVSPASAAQSSMESWGNTDQIHIDEILQDTECNCTMTTAGGDKSPFIKCNDVLNMYCGLLPYASL